MPNTRPFDKYTDEYDNWFEENKSIYLSEINAIKSVLPSGKIGMEVGIGSGKFAKPLGITIGVEPSENMAKRARKLGLKVIKGVAENLPFDNKEFDFILMVTTICFVDDILMTFKEAYRVLKPHGEIIIGFVDKESEIGRHYQKIKSKSKFYAPATFYSTEEVTNLLKEAGFKGERKIVQTVFSPTITDTDEVKQGYGEGSFVVIKQKK